jgi:hypothetical protein
MTATATQPSLEQVLRRPVPAHIAIIMDGNGRWAQRRGLPRLMGHRAGRRAVREAVEGCVALGVSVLTLSFSLENWDRGRGSARPDADHRAGLARSGRSPKSSVARTVGASASSRSRPAFSRSDATSPTAPG